MSHLSAFISGADTLGFFVAALFFARAYVRTRDALFGAFCAAFAMLGLNQLLGAVANISDEQRSWIFLLRLAAFLLVIAAIVGKNLPRRR